MSTILLRLSKPLKSVYQAEHLSPSSSWAAGGMAAPTKTSASQSGNQEALTAPGLEATHHFEQVEELLAAIRLEVQAFSTKTERHVVDLERAAVEIAMLVATKLLRDETEASRFAITETARQLIAKLDVGQRVTLFMSPTDLDSLDESIQREMAQDDINLVADAKLQPGECRADDGHDGLIASLDLQLAELRQLLLENIQGGADVV